MRLLISDPANIHALILLATVIVPALLAIILPGELKIRRVAVGAILGVVLSLFAAFYIVPHSTGDEPLTQWLIPAGALFLLVPIVRPALLRYALFTAIFLAGICLSLQYAYLTTPKNGYLGTPTLPRSLGFVRGDETDAIKAILSARGKRDHTEYPPGFMDEAPLRNTLTPIMHKSITAQGYALDHLWHSRLTRIYRLRAMKLVVWYPGGKLADGASGIHLRERACLLEDNPWEGTR